MQHIVVQGYGKSLGITSERLVVKDQSQPELHVPLRKSAQSAY